MFGSILYVSWAPGHRLVRLPLTKFKFRSEMESKILSIDRKDPELKDEIFSFTYNLGWSHPMNLLIFLISYNSRRDYHVLKRGDF